MVYQLKGGILKENANYNTCTCTCRTDYWSAKNIHGARGELAPEMPKRAPQNLHRVQCKTNWRVLFLCKKAWKAAPEMF